MWKNQKVVLLSAVVVAVLISSVVAGVTFAQDGGGGGAQPGNNTVLIDKVCTTYQENTGVALDADELKAAYTQAQTEMQTEALQSRLQDLVTQGKMTQEQADQYLQWWNSKPDMGIPLPGLCGGGGDMMMGGRGHGC
jgi:prophage tail gpP-like protein